VWIISKCLY